MELMLKKLFDFQMYERNPALQGCIDSASARCAATELSPDGMELIFAAAGNPALYGKKLSSGWTAPCCRETGKMNNQ